MSQNFRLGHAKKLIFKPSQEANGQTPKKLYASSPRWSWSWELKLCGFGVLMRSANPESFSLQLHLEAGDLEYGFWNRRP